MRQTNSKVVPLVQSNTISGFTIVEVLVSLLLGSILLALSFNLYFSTKQSEMLATTVLNTQTEARNALHFIRQGIEHAGFTTEVTNRSLKEATFKANGVFKAGQVIHIEGANEVNQSLLVRLQGDADKPLRSCDGEKIPPTDINLREIWYQYYVDEDKLMCQVYADGTKSGDALILASPVAALKLRAFTETINTTSPTTHIRNDSTNMSSNEKTKGIQVQLVIRSAERIRQDNKVTIIPITGFEDLEFDDEHFYVNTNRFFLAQNQ